MLDIKLQQEHFQFSLTLFILENHKALSPGPVPDT